MGSIRRATCGMLCPRNGSKRPMTPGHGCPSVPSYLIYLQPSIYIVRDAHESRRIKFLVRHETDSLTRYDANDLDRHGRIASEDSISLVPPAASQISTSNYSPDVKSQDIWKEGRRPGAELRNGKRKILPRAIFRGGDARGPDKTTWASRREEESSVAAREGSVSRGAVSWDEPAAKK